MGDRSAIEWTDSTWTPIRARRRDTGKVGWHCERVSPGCKHCYAATLNKRLGAGLDYTVGARNQVELFLDEKMLTQPLRWREPRRIFVCSMTDLFADFVPDEWIAAIFGIAAAAPRHTFILLTKRAERPRNWFAWLQRKIDAARKVFPDDPDGWIARHLVTNRARHFGAPSSVQADGDTWPLPNVWLIVSAEDQPTLDERSRHLLRTPAAVRGLSLEPLLAPVDLRNALAGWCPEHDFYGGFCVQRGHPGVQHINWVIGGGESGPGARPMHPAWARSIRDQCQAAGVPFFFKQWGEHRGVEAMPNGDGGVTFEPGLGLGELRRLLRWDGDHARGFGEGELAKSFFTARFYSDRVGKKDAGRLLDGREWSQFPEEVERVR